MMILIVSSVAFCLGVLVACIMAVASRESREEERRAIDMRNYEGYGDGWNHTVTRVDPPKTNPEK